MHIAPADSWLEDVENSTIAFKDEIIDLLLFLCEDAIDWERRGHIRGVVLNLVSLVSKHHLPTLEPFVVVMIVQRRSAGSTAADGCVWLNPATEVLLLALIFEEAFKLALSHSWFHVSHDIAMCFTSDL